jgi:hypothetical protein
VNKVIDEGSKRLKNTKDCGSFIDKLMDIPPTQCLKNVFEVSVLKIDSSLFLGIFAL